jgi:chemotaxis response regulator CheB
MTSTVGGHQKIKVLVVDDSAVIRTLITKLLANDPLIEVVGSASDAFAARELLVRHNPDVMTLDVEMPRMDGLNFLEKVMQHFPTRTIIISSLTPKGSQLSQKALSMGAVDVISKSNLDVSRGLGLLSDELSNRIRAAASAKIVSRDQTKVVSANVRPGQGNVFRPASGGGHGTVLCIAASTGGPEALRSLLTQLPANIPPTLIVQHMPAFFTKNFAESLTQVCAFPVREAVDGVPLSAVLAIAHRDLSLSLESISCNQALVRYCMDSCRQYRPDNTEWYHLHRCSPKSRISHGFILGRKQRRRRGQRWVSVPPDQVTLYPVLFE